MIPSYFGENQVNYARLEVKHVFFIALTLAESLRRCLNAPPNVRVFKQLPRNPVDVSGLKDMCDPYIKSSFHSSKSNNMYIRHEVRAYFKKNGENKNA